MVNTTTTNKYLWNYETITYTDGSTQDTTKRVIGTHGATGSTGAAGKDAYTVILGNESHTFAGTISAAIAATTKVPVIAYKGASQVAATIGTPTGMPTGMTHTISSNGTTSAYITFAVTSAMTTANGVVNIPITVDGKSFTKQFSYAISFKGNTGATGPAAVVYSIQPSATKVIKSITGTLTPASLTCAKYKTIGNGAATVTTEKTLKYQRLGVDSAEVAYSGAVTVTAATTSVVFSLYDGSTLLDRENVPVLSDASDLEIGGRNLLINSNFKRTTKSSGTTDKNPNLYPMFWGGYNGGVSDATHVFHAHIDNTTFDTNVVEFNESDGTRNWKAISHGFSTEEKRFLEGNTVFTFSLDAYTTLAGSKLYGGFYYTKKGSSAPSFNAGQYTFRNITVNKWGRLSAIVKLGADVDLSKAISFYIYGYGFTSNSIVYIKNMKLEVGNVATAWSPSQEDIDQDIEESLNSAKEYTNSKIEATEQKITLEVSKVQINTRNLVKNGEFKISGSTSYAVKTVGLYVPLVVGQKYTVVSKATVRGSQKYTVYDSRGMGLKTTLSKDTSTGLYTKVFTYNPSEGSNNSILRIYNYPSSTAAANPMDIEWFCIYEGEVRVPQDFNPAFEDGIQYTNSKIEQTSDSISLKVQELVTGQGYNLLYNSSFSVNTLGWANVTSSDITTVGGSKCVKVQSTSKFLNQNIKSRMLDKTVGTKMAISFDIYKPATLKVLNVRIQANATVEDTNPIDLSAKPNNTWTRITTIQTIKSESECELLLFGNKVGGSYSDSTGRYYIKNVQLEYGDKATAWKEAKGGLLATGIDILSNKIVLTSDSTMIQDSSGKQIALFTSINGKPVIKAENIDVQNLTASAIQVDSDTKDSYTIIDGKRADIDMGSYVEAYGYKQNRMIITQDAPVSGSVTENRTIIKMTGSKVMGSTKNPTTLELSNNLLKMEYLASNATSGSFMELHENYIKFVSKAVSSVGSPREHIAIGNAGIEIFSKSQNHYYNGYTGTIQLATGNYAKFYNGIMIGFTSTSGGFPTAGKQLYTETF